MVSQLPQSLAHVDRPEDTVDRLAVQLFTPGFFFDPSVPVVFIVEYMEDTGSIGLGFPSAVMHYACPSSGYSSAVDWARVGLACARCPLGPCQNAWVGSPAALAGPETDGARRPLCIGTLGIAMGCLSHFGAPLGVWLGLIRYPNDLLLNGSVFRPGARTLEPRALAGPEPCPSAQPT